MKKACTIMAALCIACTALAQATFGVKAGPDFSAYGVNYGDKETSKIITGLSGGVYVNLPVATGFYIQPSLMYEGKGGKEKEIDTKARLHYLTLPVNLLFKPEISGGNGSWILGAGAYIGYGLSGKTMPDIYDSVSVFSFVSDPFKKIAPSIPPVLKRFDAGADIQLGYEMSQGFNIRVNAELGLINIINDDGSDNSFHNISFGVMVGYTLGTINSKEKRSVGNRKR